MVTETEEKLRIWMKATINARELDILNVLWKSGKAMTGADIIGEVKGLSQNTAITVLRKLLEDGLVEVAGTVQTHSVMSRTFRPTKASKELIRNSFAGDYARFKDIISQSDICAAILQVEDRPEKLAAEIKKLKRHISECEKMLDKSTEQQSHAEGQNENLPEAFS